MESMPVVVFMIVLNTATSTADNPCSERKLKRAYVRQVRTRDK